MNIISLEVFKEAKEFKEQALDKIRPGAVTLAQTYELFEAQAEANRLPEEKENPAAGHGAGKE